MGTIINDRRLRRQRANHQESLEGFCRDDWISIIIYNLKWWEQTSSQNQQLISFSNLKVDHLDLGIVQRFGGECRWVIGGSMNLQQNSVFVLQALLLMPVSIFWSLFQTVFPTFLCTLVVARDADTPAISLFHHILLNFMGNLSIQVFVLIVLLHIHPRYWALSAMLLAQWIL